MQGHHFGQWPAISAMIAEETQKNLNLDDQDFLIEIWFKPLAVLKYKWGTSFLVGKNPVMPWPATACPIPAKTSR